MVENAKIKISCKSHPLTNMTKRLSGESERKYSRTFETLEDVIREAREELCTYQDILEISDRIKQN